MNLYLLTFICVIWFIKNKKNTIRNTIQIYYIIKLINVIYTLPTSVCIYICIYISGPDQINVYIYIERIHYIALHNNTKHI